MIGLFSFYLYNIYISQTYMYILSFIRQQIIQYEITLAPLFLCYDEVYNSSQFWPYYAGVDALGQFFVVRQVMGLQYEDGQQTHYPSSRRSRRNVFSTTHYVRQPVQTDNTSCVRPTEEGLCPKRLFLMTLTSKIFKTTYYSIFNGVTHQ